MQKQAALSLNERGRALRITAIVSALSLALVLGCAGASAASAAYMQGATRTIATADELAALATEVNAGTLAADTAITLTADIDLSSIASWTPIGSSSTTPFKATFDGQGHTISGLTISAATGGQGLFGWNGGTIKDFTLSGTISAGSGDYVGAVAAYNKNAISDVHGSVAISTGNTYNVGGIAGENAGTIQACFSAATVDGTNAGSKNGVGGIAGRNGNNNTALEAGVIESCYFVGTVGRASQKWTGGITGFNNEKSSIKTCYMAGTLVAGVGYNNAIAGSQEGSSLTSNNYALSCPANTGSTEAEIGIVKSEDELKAAASLLDSTGKVFLTDSANINNGYPILYWQAVPTIAVADIDEQVWTAPRVEPEPVVTDGSTGATLVKDTDYTVTYTDNTAVGTATATITPIGAYAQAEAVDKSFSIVAADIADMTVAPIADQSYDGTAKEPALSITDAADNTLVAGTDYDVSYSNNTAAGTATATITGKGNYTGTKTATFKIVAKGSGEIWKRVAGGTAATTARKVYKEGLAHGGWGSDAIFATSTIYQDALCGAALCGKESSIIVLADDKNSKNVDAVIAKNKKALEENCYVFGGEKAVSATVYKAIEAASK